MNHARTKLIIDSIYGGNPEDKHSAAKLKPVVDMTSLQVASDYVTIFEENEEF